MLSFDQAFADIAEDAIAQDIKHCAPGGIADLVIKPTGAVTFAAYSVRAVSNIAYLAETFKIYLNGFSVVFVVGFLYEIHRHIRIKKLLSVTVICSCYCEENLFHDQTSL